MARPIKYPTGQDKIEAAQPTRNLIQEIKTTSGKTYAEISAALNAYPLQPYRLAISEATLKKYASGNSPMGKQRMTNVAKVAFSLGWLSLENYWTYNFEFDLAAHEANLSEVQRDAYRKSRLFQAMRGFADAGYFREEVQAVIDNAYQKLAHEFESNPPRVQMLER